MLRRGPAGPPGTAPALDTRRAGRRFPPSGLSVVAAHPVRCQCHVLGVGHWRSLARQVLVKDQHLDVVILDVHSDAPVKLVEYPEAIAEIRIVSAIAFL